MPWLSGHCSSGGLLVITLFNKGCTQTKSGEKRRSSHSFLTRPVRFGCSECTHTKKMQPAMARKKLNKLNFCQSFKGGIFTTPRFHLLNRGKNKRHNLMYVNEVTHALSGLQHWTHTGRFNIISSTSKRICQAITSAHQSKRWWYHLSAQGHFGKSKDRKK